MDLEKTVEKARRGLKKVQRADEKTKRRYLILMSSLTMVVVIGLWFFYLTLTLPEPPASHEAPVGAVVREENEDSFFRTIGRGAENIFEGLKNQFKGLKESFTRVNEFTIESY
ncbi:MAG: hypothetical protein HY378_01625 [Candidatus Brennerbacteria bacterium]|nr:hypothetical protein [Candidatus Brennerbacteria bacterium]